MGIGPSDQSEKAHPPMTIVGHQSENNMEDKELEDVWHLTQWPQTPQNKWSNVTTPGKNMALCTGGLWRS